MTSSRESALKALSDVLYELEEQSLRIIASIDGVLRLPDVPQAESSADETVLHRATSLRSLSPTTYAQLIHTQAPKDIVTVRLSEDFMDICVPKAQTEVQIDLSSFQ